MPKCPNCGEEIEEEHYVCDHCGAQLPTVSETEPEAGDQPLITETEIRQEDRQPEEAAVDVRSVAMPAGMAVPEPLDPEPRPRRTREERPRQQDTWDRMGEAWNEMAVGAQVAVISSLVGIAGFVALLFVLAQAGIRANIQLWILILPFVVSFYLLFSSADAPLRVRILTYSAIAALGSLWLLPVLQFSSSGGLWWALSLLGILGLIGGGFLALWDSTRNLEG